MRKGLSPVTVVIPAYNAADTIARALKSAYAQTYDDIAEVIVVDDGSTDDTARVVCREFPQVTLIQQENSGVGAARNAGISKAENDYVALLDADDEWLPEKTARQMAILAREPEVDYCACLPQISTQYRCRRPYRETPGSTETVRFLPYLRDQHPPIGCSVIARRSALVEVGGYDEHRTFLDLDLDLWLRVLASGQRLVMLKEHLYRWHIQSTGLSQGRGALAMHESRLKILDKWAPGKVAEARNLLTLEQHAQIERRALLSASRCYAYYGELDVSRKYAEQARGTAAAGSCSLSDSLLLTCLLKAPSIYGAGMRGLAVGTDLIKRLVRRRRRSLSDST